MSKIQIIFLCRIQPVYNDSLLKQTIEFNLMTIIILKSMELDSKIINSIQICVQSEYILTIEYSHNKICDNIYNYLHSQFNNDLINLVLFFTH